jgi:hypothetical protein
MCLGSSPKASAPSQPKMVAPPPPPAPVPPPTPPAPAPKALQETGSQPKLQMGSTRTSQSGRKKTTAGSLRTGLNINTGGDGGLNV